MSEPLLGRIVAIIGQGNALDRALAVACAEAGADLALATVTREAAQEFAMNSIANEAWSLDRDQFVVAMDSNDATAVQAFAEQTWDRYGRCDILIAAHFLPSTAPLDELSPDEWEAALQTNVTGPFLAAHAFGVLMARSGGGSIALLGRDVEGADAAYRAAMAALLELYRALNDGWEKRGVHTLAWAEGNRRDPADIVADIVRSLSGR